MLIFKCFQTQNIEAADTHPLPDPEYAMPIVKDRKLYRCQLGPCERGRMMEAAVLVVEDSQKPGALRLKNTSGAAWTAFTPSGAQKTVKQEETVPVMPGIAIFIDGVELRIEKLG